MSNYVIQASEQKITEMKNYYKTSVTRHVPPGALFVAKQANVTITAYRSGKVLFQGKDAEKEARKWEHSSASPQKKEEQKQPPAFHTMSAIGSDEVGTGDYFGPIVVVAAYVDKRQIDALRNMGVKDSKQLTDGSIRQLAPLLMRDIRYKQTVLDNREYNQWQRSGMPQTKMKALLHNEAIVNLVNELAPLQPEAVIIDQFIERDLYFRYLEGEGRVVREHVYCVPKAESVHIAVAAASIIARYFFLCEMDRLSETIGIELPKGAGEQIDKTAAHLIKMHGESVLDTCAKLHFANTKKAKRIVSKA